MTVAVQHLRKRSRTAAVTALVVLVLALSACSGNSSGDDVITLRYATGNAEGNPAAEMETWWMDQIEERTDGRVEFERNFGGSLLGNVDIPAAVKDGRIDAGHVASLFVPQDLPLSEVAGIPFLGANTNELANLHAFTKLYAENKDLRREYHDYGIEMAFFLSAPSAIAFTRKPLKELDDLKGKKLRAVGFAAEALKLVGADPVAIDAPDMYQAIQQGVIDGTGSFGFANAPSFGMHEVAPHASNLLMGQYAITGVVFNKKTSDQFPDDIRDTIAEVSADVLDGTWEKINTKFDTAACDQHLENDGTVTVFESAEIADWRKEVNRTLVDKWVANASKLRGIEKSAVRDFLDQLLDAREEFNKSVEYVPGADACASRQ